MLYSLETSVDISSLLYQEIFSRIVLNSTCCI